MDQLKTVGIYSVPKNEGLSCIFEVMQFKMAYSAPRLYKTYIGLYQCTGLRH